MSHDIVNELITIMGHSVLRKVSIVSDQVSKSRMVFVDCR